MGSAISEEIQIDPEMKRHAGLSPEQVKRLREKFELISDSFGLDRIQLGKLIKLKNEEIESIFKHFDADNNGKVDAYEFICSLAMLADANVKEKAEIMFSLYDFDKSGSISLDECIILMRSALAAIHAMSKLPPPTIQEVEANTLEFFNKADTNKDKEINLAEFISYVSRDKAIMRILKHFNMLSKADLRFNFGEESEDSIDPSSDLEEELLSQNRWKRNERQQRAMQEGIEYIPEGEFSQQMEESTEDRYEAVKTWIGSVQAATPSGYQYKRGDDDIPDANLELEYVFGYRCHDCRNNLRYDSTGHVVYHTASLGVSLNIINNTQKFFNGHTDDITAFALHPNKHFVATGQVGRNPEIFVWDSENMEQLAVFQGYLKRGIRFLAFSPSGKLLAAMGNDEENTIVVYDFDKVNKKATQGNKQAAIIAAGKAGKEIFCDMSFLSEDIILTCGVKIFQNIQLIQGNLKIEKGIGWGKSQQTQLQTLLCIGHVGNQVLTGAYNGCLFKWNGRNLQTFVKIHEQYITCLIKTKQGGIITGSNDGSIAILDQQLQIQKQFSLRDPSVQSMMPRVRSVCEGEGRILVGTRGGEIVEFNTLQPQVKVLMRGHYQGELHGLAIHPRNDEYVTVGEDSMLCIWDPVNKIQKKCIRLDGLALVAAISTSGELLAVGFKSGHLHIFNYQSLQLVFKSAHRDKSITGIKFSPDNTLLAVGAHDAEIILYDVKSFEIRKRLRGFRSSITHFDFSRDSKVIQSNSSDFEILYHSTESGKRDPSGASSNRNEVWQSWSCTIGWPVQGIWPECSDGTDINSVDRSPSRNVIATADNFGKIKLLKFPCVSKGSSFIAYRGHSNNVTNCCFLRNKYLITVGGRDKAVFQWKYVEEQEQTAFTPLEDLDSVDTEDFQGLQGGKNKKQQQTATNQEENMFELEEAGEGEQLTSAKPWKGEIMNSQPSNWSEPPGGSSPPDAFLQLSWVHGYRGFDCRNNVFFTRTGAVVYPAASLGIVLNYHEQKQEFQNCHDEDIVSLAIHPQRDIVATGQLSTKGSKRKHVQIYVWDVNTHEVISCLKGFHIRAVTSLDFSPDGQKLLSIGNDDDHSIAIYEWRSQKLLATSKVDKDKVFDAKWKNDSEFITCGAKHIKF